jgi:predicted acetyltransferase
MKRYRVKRKTRRGIGRKKRSFLKKKLFWELFLITLGALSFGYILFLSPLFEIKSIQVVTNDIFLKKELSALLGKSLGKNIFLADSESVRKMILEEYPQVASASLEKKFPEKLILKIEKRKPVANFCYSEEECYLIDEKGFSFTDNFSSSSSLPFIFSQTPPDYRGIKKVLMINDAFQKKLGFKILRFNFLPDRVTVVTKEGWEVYFDFKKDTGLDLIKLDLLFEKELPKKETKNLKYIDLRFSKVYYK